VSAQVEFEAVVAALQQRKVRYLLIGISGINYYAPHPGLLFSTQDFDLYLPADPDNLLAAWEVCEGAGLELTVSGEPLDQPRDRWLAERVVENRALTRARRGLLWIDLTFVMGAFDFEAVWPARREFAVRDSALCVANLEDLVRAKEAAGRDKDLLFLATHRDALQQHYGLGRYSQPPLGPRPGSATPS